MAYDEKLAERVRKALSHLHQVDEKKMFRGLAFMVDGKMCVCVSGNELMCRFDPMLQKEVLANDGVRKMVMNGKVLDGYCYVDQAVLANKKDLDYWIKLALAFNPKAKASKKKSAKPR